MSDPVSTFRQLHESGCFVMPNPWDEGTAVFLQNLGFKALATTSAGFAFTHALPDDVKAIPCEAMLAHVREIVSVSRVPVNADFQAGYADTPEGVEENVALCVATGVAGLSIEDATGNDMAPLYERSLAIERVRAARAAIDATTIRAVLTARCEAWLVGDAHPFRTAMDRLVAYAEAGADCLYAPGVREPSEILALVRAVHPKPVNVLMSSAVPGLSISSLAGLGVRRISVGSALARIAWGAFMRAAKNIAETGTFDDLANAATFAEVNAIFRARS
jgi:2-methylisocitrate lyase-like PEP mutase family enzyme